MLVVRTMRYQQKDILASLVSGDMLIKYCQVTVKLWLGNKALMAINSANIFREAPKKFPCSTGRHPSYYAIHQMICLNIAEVCSGIFPYC